MKTGRVRTKKHPRTTTKAQKIKQQKRIKLIISVTLVLSACFIATLAYFSLFIAPKQENAKNFLALKQEITAERHKYEPEYDATRSHRLQALYAAGIAANEKPAYSAKNDTCLLKTQTSQWVVTQRDQTCYLFYADLLETTLAPDAIHEKLQQDSTIAQYFNTPVTLASIVTPCKEPSAPETLTYIKTDGDITCSTPKIDIARINGEVHETTMSQRVIRFINYSQVDYSKQYILVQYSGQYFSKEVSCAKQGIAPWGCAPFVSPPLGD